MNVYDSARMADVLAPLGYRADATRAEDADLVILNTCHIREKATERSFPISAGCALQRRASATAGGRMMRRGRRLRGAGRRRRDPAPRAGCRYGVRAADLSPPAGDGGAGRARRRRRCSTPNFPAEPKFDFLPADPGAPRRQRVSCRSRKAATSSAPSASCPIRAARNIRGPAAAIVAEARRLVELRRARDHAARARTSTPITARPTATWGSAG